MSEPHGTICKCGLAKSYHGPPTNLADHDYEPRYAAARAAAPSFMERVADVLRADPDIQSATEGRIYVGPPSPDRAGLREAHEHCAGCRGYDYLDRECRGLDMVPRRAALAAAEPPGLDEPTLELIRRYGEGIAELRRENRRLRAALAATEPVATYTEVERLDHPGNRADLTPENPAGLREALDAWERNGAANRKSLAAFGLRAALAATEPGLDVERLARALAVYGYDREFGKKEAVVIAAEYARLSQPEPRP